MNKEGERNPESTHPLEGKFVVFEYFEADPDYEGSALEVYQLINGKLKGIFVPGALYDTYKLEDCSSEINERAIDTLKKLGITKVYTIIGLGEKDIFGMPEYYVINEEKGRILSYLEHNPILYGDIDELLKQEGIELEYYEEK